jgi:hypothetical protein
MRIKVLKQIFWLFSKGNLRKTGDLLSLSSLIFITLWSYDTSSSPCWLIRISLCQYLAQYMPSAVPFICSPAFHTHWSYLSHHPHHSQAVLLLQVAFCKSISTVLSSHTLPCCTYLKFIPVISAAMFTWSCTNGLSSLYLHN